MTYLITPMHFFFNVNLNEETEFILTTAQDRGLRTNYTPPPPKKKIDKQDVSSVCGPCRRREREVTLSYIMAEFKKLA